MTCPNCNKEIAEDILACPECGAEIDAAIEKRKDKKKEFSHYKVILIYPGPREGIIDFLSEITGQPVKEIQKNLGNLPWVVDSRLPLNKAQELKVMLETKRAVVKVEGMDIWEEENLEVAEEKTDKPDKRTGKLQWGLIVVLSLSLISVSFYFLSRIDQSNQQDFLRNLNPSINIDQIEPSTDLQTSLNFSPDITRQNKSIDYDLRDDGYNPYVREIIIRFDLQETTTVTVSLFDVNAIKIAVLLQANLDPESYRLRWRGTVAGNSSVNPGIYIVELFDLIGPSYHKIVWLPDNK